MVARRLETKLRDHVASTTSQRGGRDAGYGGDGLSSLQRPCKLLAIVDRVSAHQQCLSSLTEMST
jgi:hypothetical protein